MKVNKLNESQEASVARILSSKNYPRGFKWLSNNGTSGEVNFNGIDYAFRKLDDGSYKVMTSADAGWNWSETLFKDESLHENINGFVKTRCSECGKVNRVEVNFPEYNKPFEDTKYTCSECGTENLLHDNHEYNDDGTLKEDFETNVDVILFNSYGQEIDRRTFSEDGLKDGFRVMMAKDEWEFQPGDTIRFEYTEHEYDEYDESMNEGIFDSSATKEKAYNEAIKSIFEKDANAVAFSIANVAESLVESCTDSDINTKVIRQQLETFIKVLKNDAKHDPIRVFSALKNLGAKFAPNSTAYDDAVEIYHNVVQLQKVPKIGYDAMVYLASKSSVQVIQRLSKTLEVLKREYNESILTEGKWSHKVPDEMAKDLRKAINDDNYEVVITTLISIYNYLQDILPEDYDDFIDYAIEDLEFLDITPDADEDEMEEFYDDVNSNLDRFYDFCDDLKIWIPI